MVARERLYRFIYIIYIVKVESTGDKVKEKWEMKDGLLVAVPRWSRWRGRVLPVMPKKCGTHRGAGGPDSTGRRPGSSQLHRSLKVQLQTVAFSGA